MAISGKLAERRNFYRLKQASTERMRAGMFGWIGYAGINYGDVLSARNHVIACHIKQIIIETFGKTDLGSAGE
ncbi:hypothetical protein [Frigoriglobus tundricola]|nr:hypothetical protein [Frigoriglobus tundricola]